MIRPADIREGRNHDVVDPKGHKIGRLEAVRVDTTTDEPAMATVQTGLPTRHRLVLVPLMDLVLGPGYVKIAYDRKLVRKAPWSAPTTSCRLSRKRRFPVLRHAVSARRGRRTPAGSPLTAGIHRGGESLMAVLLFPALVAVVPALIGAVAEGPGYLLIIGIAVLVAASAVAAVHRSRHLRRRPVR